MRIDRHVKKALVLLAALAVLPTAGFAAGGEMQYDAANHDIHNQASLQRGARSWCCRS